MWCEKREKWMDRGLVAVLDIAPGGRGWFAGSSTDGEASEATRGNAEHDGEPLILGVDASRLHRARQPR